MAFSLTYITPQRSDLSELSILSNELKPILVLLNEQDHTVENTLLLKKILKAIELDENNDISCFYLLENQYIKDLTNQLQEGKKVIVFGLDPNRLSLNIVTHFYHPLAIGNHTFLFSHRLSELTKERKIKLWSSLKQWFHVK